MAKFQSLLFVFLALCGLSACESKPTKVEETQNWSGQMQHLDQVMKEMIPIIYDRGDFTDPKNEKRIIARMTDFSKSVHKISPERSEQLIGEDPLFTFSLNRFKSDLGRAKDSFELGHKEYSRSVMKSVVGHCFRCHTRTTMGPEFQGDKMDFSGLKLNRLEKADLLVASRRYDEALSVLESIIDDKNDGGDFPFEMERALRRYLSMMIRVRKDPSRAIAKMDQIMERKTVPYYLLEDVRKWKKSLESWSVQTKAGQSVAKKDSIKSAKDEIRKARLAQGFRKDHGGDVEYLVATSLLHDGLTGLKKASERSEAYFLLGESYEVLGDLGSWNLHEFYFESCVREWPKGPLARKCYERLEESVYVGYSGSSGVHVPYHEKKRLSEIKDLISVR